MKVEAIVSTLEWLLDKCEELLKEPDDYCITISEPIGERIKRARKGMGLTQKQLAELSDTSQSMIAGYELGKRSPKVGNIMKISKALGVNLLQDYAKGGHEQ